MAILCGGRGSRLRPATDEIPKALVEVNGRTILDNLIDFYRSKGHGEFILCVGYKADMVRAHYDSSPSEIDVAFSDAGEDARMIERIWRLRDEA